MYISFKNIKNLNCSCGSKLDEVSYDDSEPFETWTCPKCGTYSVVIEGEHTKESD